ncbi:MAG: 30S ribosomal protein S16 [bacterium]
MLTFKLERMGKKNKPTFRLIITEKEKDPYDKSLEILGNYNPQTKEAVLKEDRIKHWLSKGAQATTTVQNLLISKGLMEGKKVKVYSLTKKRHEKMKAEKEKAGIISN